ncbi:N-acetylmannosamine-6-phosphate 2-epimerase [Borrelia miyamotoi FR64b]|nr:N-acetylmannosamine-6-phosphate 2-epimerase [Borrelia miyamotoi FR64b]
MGGTIGIRANGVLDINRIKLEFYDNIYVFMHLLL